MRQPHKIQLEILKKLLFVEKLRHTDLKPTNRIENNQVDFHIKELIKSGFVQKKDKFYQLTSVGKEYSNRMDTEKVVISSQAKVSAWFCCRRTTKKGYEYLIYTRLKQPFYGCHGFPSGKVKYGETANEAAIRELNEETGLNGKPKIIQIKHYLVFDKKSKDLLEDKFMFLFLFDSPKGILKTNKEGKYEWVEKNNLRKYVTNPFESYTAFNNQLKLIDNFDGSLKLVEEKHFTNKF